MAPAAGRDLEPASVQVERSSRRHAGTVTDRVPVTVIAGFLGSGKTTLLNHILQGQHGVRVAVFVNDFGSIDIDSRLVTRRDADVIALDNGCICCTIGADLVSQLTGLIEGPSCPEHVLVECSGVSDPGRLLLTLRDAHFRRLARVDGVIALVDAATVSELPPHMLELARRQLASADVIVFNKVDLVAAAELASVRERFTYPTARVLEATHADVPLEVLLGVQRRAASPVKEATGAGHAEAFTTWAWTCEEPLRLDDVRAALGSLPAGVFRAKGFVYVAEAPEQRVVAHVVGRRVDMRPLGAWDGAPPRTELVFVSLDPEVDRAGIAEILDRACKNAKSR